jgi:hypothetical protein
MINATSALRSPILGRCLIVIAHNGRRGHRPDASPLGR